MPEYDLGKAHGTVEIDYKGTGATDAREDIEDIGTESERTSEKIDKSSKQSQESYRQLAEAAKRASESLDIDSSSLEQLGANVKQLEKDVTQASTAAANARDRLRAAEENLEEVRNRAGATARDIAQAEANVRRAQQSTVSATTQLQNSTRALTTARERLARVPQPRNPDPPDAAAWRQFVQTLQQVQSNTAKSSSILNTFSGRMRLALAAVAIATPGVAGLGVALASLAGLAGVAAGALAGLAAVGGTVVTGVSGVADAFKASAQQAKAAGGSAAASAKAQRAAARAIEQAKRSLTDAEQNLRDVQAQAARAAVQAARQVLDAQRDLVNAQRDAVRAQQALNKARQQATRDLEDMRDALRGGALDERQAVLDLKDAQEELARVTADPTANADDIARATLNYDKAVFALEQLRKENQRLAVDQADAAAKGVAGSEQVVNAQDAVRSSADEVRDAQQALADAQENVRQVQIDSARQISDAVQGVIEAQRNLKDAYEDAAEAAAGGGGAADKFAEAMADLSPNARAFVQEVINLKGEWDSLKRSVQDELFAGLAAEVRPLADRYFPILREGMGGIARGLNSMAKEAIGYLKTTEAQANVKNIFDNTAQAVQNLSGVARDLIAAFLDIASVGSDFLPDMATGAANAAARFREFIAAAKESGQLRQWMQDAMDTAGQLWQLLKNLGSIIVTVFTGLDQSGGGALTRLVELTAQVDKFLKSAEGQEALKSLGEILSSIGGAYGKVFLTFLDVAASVLVALAPLITAFADAVGIYLVVALKALEPVLTAIASVLGFLGPALGPVIAGIYAANKAVDAAKLAWGALNVVMKANPFILIASAIIALALLIIQNWDSISAFLSETWTWIKDTATSVWTAISDFFTGIVTNIVTGIRDQWTAITTWLSDTWNNIKNTATTLWNRIDTFFKDVGRRISDGFKNTIDFIITTARELPGKVINFLKSLPGKLADWAGDLISGVVRGLGNMASAIWDKLKSIVSNAWDSVLDFFGISSPSRLAMEAGEYIMIGLAQGIDAAGNAAVAAAANMAQAVGDELTGASSTLASTINLGADTSGLPTDLAMNAMLAGKAPGALGEATRGGDGARSAVIHIDNLTLQVAGNLDPTNPTAFRQTIVRLKDAIRSVDLEYK
jgi:phage-related protein